MPTLSDTTEWAERIKNTVRFSAMKDCMNDIHHLELHLEVTNAVHIIEVLHGHKVVTLKSLTTAFYISTSKWSSGWVLWRPHYSSSHMRWPWHEWWQEGIPGSGKKTICAPDNLSKDSSGHSHLLLEQELWLQEKLPNLHTNSKQWGTILFKTKPGNSPELEEPYTHNC